MEITSDQKMQVKSLKSPQELLEPGPMQVKLPVLEQPEVIVDIDSLISLNFPMNLQTIPNLKNNQSVMLESLPTVKRKIWKPRLKPSKVSSLLTNASKTLDQASTGNVRGFCPYWNSYSQDLSQNLLSHIKIDSVGSALNYSQELLNSTEEKSWFSMKKKLPRNKNSCRISSQLLQSLVPNSTAYVVTHSNEKLDVHSKTKKPTEKEYKALKIRVFPTESEEQKLLLACAQHRWYYNACVDVFDLDSHMEEVNASKSKEEKYAPKASYYSLRDSLYKYDYIEEQKGNILYCDLVYDENRKALPKPKWIENSSGILEENKFFNSRIARGAVKNYIGNLNSAVSNYYNNNISEFELKHKTTKGKHEFVLFEDCHMPSYIKDLKGRYSYRLPRGNNKRRTSITLQELFSIHDKVGCIVIKDKQTKEWTIYLPVERDWYPPNDCHSENQGNTIKGEAIALDPGMRKVFTGVTSTGKIEIFGDRAYETVIPLLYEITKLESKLKKNREKTEILTETEVKKTVEKKARIWRRIKNLIQELHWKCANYLARNYEYIFLGDFKVKDCIKKKNKLKGIVKRILNQYAFYQFKQRLEYECEKYGSKVIYVHEALTTKTCSCCGNISHTVGSSEEYCCSKCNNRIDRDVNSAINILIKGLTALKAKI